MSALIAVSRPLADRAACSLTAARSAPQISRTAALIIAKRRLARPLDRSAIIGLPLRPNDAEAEQLGTDHHPSGGCGGGIDLEPDPVVGQHKMQHAAGGA